MHRYFAAVPEFFAGVKPGEFCSVKLHMQAPGYSVLTSLIPAHTVPATLRRLPKKWSDGKPCMAALITEGSHPKENVWEVHLASDESDHVGVVASPSQMGLWTPAYSNGASAKGRGRMHSERSHHSPGLVDSRSEEVSQEVNAQSYSGTQLAPTFWIFSPETGIVAPSWRTLISIV